MRRRFVWDPLAKELVEAAPRRCEALHFIQPDLPGYESPVSGLWVEGRRARRDDLARTHSRPWEGLEQERKEAAKGQAANERRLDQLAERMAHRAWAEAPERIRRVFRSR
jgi:hypothetical protein